MILILIEKCGDTCDMKGNSGFRIKIARKSSNFTKVSDKTCGVTPFEGANIPSLRS